MKYSTYITLKDAELRDFIELLHEERITYILEKNTVMLDTSTALDVFNKFLGDKNEVV